MTTDSTTDDLRIRLERLEQRERATKRGLIVFIVLWGVFAALDHWFFRTQTVKAYQSVHVGDHAILLGGDDSSLLQLNHGAAKLLIGVTDKGTLMSFDDADGRPRIHLGLRNGKPAIEFLDADGKTTWSQE
jgi:hypothetical protein